MGLFNFKKRESDPARTIQRMIDYMPEFYRNHRQFENCVQYFKQGELGLALNSLIELTEETGHNFSEEFWAGLSDAASKMGLKEEVHFCREQAAGSQNELRSKIPFGSTLEKIDDTHVQYHTSTRLKDENAEMRRKKDKVMALSAEDGVHLKLHDLGGFIYLVDKGRIAEIDVELAASRLVLCLEKINYWSIPTRTEMTQEEISRIKRQLTSWSAKSRNPVEFVESV
ncbi:hypothetical protein WBG78_04540 [Chryseolinea sp. T2]|uniref:hypothetical protein n=1 Tax=Chryseolinea sp. T2 TaxID=3129255 RepID=UPI00307748B3